MNNNIPEERLQDIKNGKETPWKQKKQRSIILAESFSRLEKPNKAYSVWTCGTILDFKPENDNKGMRLHRANFCRERLCPMCQWRKSLKVFHQVSRVMDLIQERNPELVPIFLTLTLKNCGSIELSETLNNIYNGWYLMTKHRTIKTNVKGWFRALEVTYNDKEDTFHPHIHVILLVDKSYFKSNKYLKTEDWVHLWRVSMSLDYDPICFVQKVKNKTEKVKTGSEIRKYKAVAEVAKYAVKDSEYLTYDSERNDYLVEIYSSALRGRRLYAFGGIMKVIAKELKLEDVETGDLVNVDGQEIREDVATAIITYHFNFGIGDYIRKR